MGYYESEVQALLDRAQVESPLAFRAIVEGTDDVVGTPGEIIKTIDYELQALSESVVTLAKGIDDLFARLGLSDE
jgi:hypothetical protein